MKGPSLVVVRDCVSGSAGTASGRQLFGSVVDGVRRAVTLYGSVRCQARYCVIDVDIGLLH